MQVNTMKSLLITGSAALLSAGVASTAHAVDVTVTAQDIVDASGVTTNDLGTKSVTVGNLTVWSDQSSSANLGYSTSTAGTTTLGVTFGSTTSDYGLFETTGLELLFDQPALVKSMTFGRYSTDGDNLVISGFSSDPDTTIDAPVTFTQSFNSFNNLLIDPPNLDPPVYIETFDLNFADPPEADSFYLQNGFDGSAIGFVSVTYEIVPEPSSLALLGLGGLLIARRFRH